MKHITDQLVIVRGAGDLATGVILRLVHSGFPVIALEIENPLVIRRTVALASAIYRKQMILEGITSFKIDNPNAALKLTGGERVPILVDPNAESIRTLKPDIVIDAILAKRNLGTHLDMAPTIIALGPGFTAGVDVHAVIETNRGHDLGRVLLSGKAEPDTGTPGIIAGYGAERVVRAPTAGTVKALCQIGDVVSQGQPILALENESGEIQVPSPIEGVLRGLIHPGLNVSKGMKIADVDPRGNPEYCFSVSDKARAIGGGVLEAILYLSRKNKHNK